MGKLTLRKSVTSVIVASTLALSVAAGITISHAHKATSNDPAHNQDGDETGQKTNPFENVNTQNVEKTGSYGLIDEYTITFDDGTTSRFIVINGEDGPDAIQAFPNDGGHTPTVRVGENGNWVINENDTGLVADVNRGLADVEPHVGENGNWWIGGVDTGASSQGQPGLTPFIGENGNWWIGETDTGVHAGGGSGGGQAGENGKSAYELAQDLGFEGTLQEWLLSLVGPAGKSAYELMQESGYTGSYEEFIAGLVGADGKSAYELYCQNHEDPDLSEAEWLESLKGADGNGKSAYEIYCDLNSGDDLSEAEWLASLAGKGVTNVTGPATDGLYDTYSINYTDGSHDEFVVKNGEAGKDGSVTLFGDVDPDELQGVNGDSYINTQTWDYYVKEDNAWVNKGNIKGGEGGQGEQGQAGQNGKSIYAAAGEPEADLGNVGDSYVNVTTGDYYVKDDTGWGDPIGSLKGANGAAGNGIASIALTDDTDATKDVYTITYTDTTTSTFEIAKPRSIVSIVRTSGDGSAGTTDTYTITYNYGDPDTFTVTHGSNGNTILTGEDAPDNSLGRPGDVYIDYVNQDIYLKGIDDWSVGVSFKGADGRGIAAIEKSGPEADGLTYTYTITYTDNSTPFVFTVTNGAAGADGLKVVTGNALPTVLTNFQEGDSFIDTTNWNYYVLQSDGADGYEWDYRGNIRGTALYTGHIGDDAPTVEENYKAGDSYLNLDNWNYYVLQDNAGTLEWHLEGNIHNSPYEYEITFDSNGGSAVAGIDDAKEGHTITKPATDPTKAGYFFQGWYTVEGNKWDFSKDVVTGDTTLYAHWAQFEVTDGVLTGCTATGDVIIPEYFDGQYISAIDADLFKNKTGITSIALPNSIREIGDSAFQGCTDLESVVLSNNVTLIGDNAFNGCNKLRYIYLGEGLREIGAHAFDGCAELRNVIVPVNVETIGEQAFFGCTNLDSVNILGASTVVGANAFQGCTSLRSLTLNNFGNSLTFNGFFEDEYDNDLNMLNDRYQYIYSPAGNIFINGKETNYHIEGCARNDIEYCESDPEDGHIYICIEPYSDPSDVCVLTWNGSEYVDYTGEPIIQLPNVRDIDSNNWGRWYIGDTKTNYYTNEADNSSIADGIGDPYDNDQYANLRWAYVDTYTGDIYFVENYGSEGNLYINADTGMLYQKVEGLWHELGVVSELTGINSYDVGAGAPSTHNSNDYYIDSQDANVYHYDSGSWTLIKSLSYQSKVLGDYFNGAANVPQSLKTVTISGDCTAIPNNAFKDCQYIEEIVFSDKVVSIGAHAFDGCTSLRSINLPNSLKTIGDYAYKGCTAFGDVVIPSTIQSIGLGAFENCQGMRSITIPFVGADSTGHSWMSYIFGNSSLSATPNVPSTLKTITVTNITRVTDRAFYGMSGIETINLPNNLTSYGASAFEGCTSLRNLTEQKSLTMIYSKCFKDCTSLTSIVLPNTLQEIESNIFSGCTSLKEITLPYLGQTSTYAKPLYYFFNEEGSSADVSQSLKKVTIATNGAFTSGAFENCAYLEEVVLPEGPTTINELMFHGCSRLKTFSFPSTVTSIGSRAFEGCNGFASFIIPGTIQTIGSAAFKECENLAIVVIPNSVTTIGSSAFQDCSILNFANLPSNLSTLGDDAFNGCALESVIIPSTLNEVGENAFYENNLRYIAFAERTYSLTIDEHAFANNVLLEALIIPDETIEIGIGAFEGCNNVKSVTLPFIGDRYELEDYYFDGTVFGYIFGAYDEYDNASYVPASLKTVVVTKGNLFDDKYDDWVETSMTDVRFPHKSFTYCENIETIVIPEEVTYLGVQAFQYCSSLKNVVFKGYTTINIIEDSLFDGCQSLETFTVPASVETINNGAFSNCTSLKYFTYEEDSLIKTIYAGAFQCCTSLEYYIEPASCVNDNIDYLGENSRIFADCNSLKQLVLKGPDFNINSSYQWKSYDMIALGRDPTEADYALDDYVWINTSTYDVWMYYGDSGYPEQKYPTYKPARANYGWTKVYNLKANPSCNVYTSTPSYANDGDVIIYLADANINGTPTTKTAYDYYMVREKGLWVQRSFRNIGIGWLFGDSSNVKVPHSLEYVSIGGTKLSKSFFANYSSLETIILTDGCYTIESNAFLNCSNLKTLVLPDSIDKVEANILKGCSSLENVTLPFIGDYYDNEYFGYVFGAPSAEAQSYYIPSNLREVTVLGGGDIADKAFYNCFNLTTINLPKTGVTTIGSQAFRGCNSLRSIVIPKGVTTIGTQAFQYCNSLSQIVLPNTITTISGGSQVFGATMPLKTVYCECSESSDCATVIKNALGSGDPVNYVWDFTEPYEN